MTLLKMTLTDSEDTCIMQQDQNQIIVGEALREAIWQAMEQGRLTCGVYECVELLEINPYDVMFCVLPEDSTYDVAIYKLIEAFCLENEIKLLKANSYDTLAKVVKGRTVVPLNDNDVSTGRASVPDVGCVIIQYPQDNNSKEDQIVSDYFKSQGKMVSAPIDIPA